MSTRRRGSGRVGVLVPVLLALAPGCRPCATSIPPALGGTPEQRSHIDAVLGVWESIAAPEAVCVNEVVVTERMPRRAPAGALASYTEGRGTIHLDERLSLEALSVVAPHEACHGAHYALDLRESVGDRFDVDPSLIPEQHENDRRYAESEGIAYLCERGPESLRLVAAAAADCGIEIERERAQIVLDQVYPSNGGPMPPSRLRLGSLRTVALAESEGRFEGNIWHWYGTTVVGFELTRPNGSRIPFPVDLETGEAGFELVDDLGVRRVDDLGAAEWDAPTAWSTASVQRLASGEEIQALRTWLPSGQPLYVGTLADPTGIALVEGTCRTARTRIYEVEGTLWMFSFDGAAVEWRVVE